MTNSDRHQWRRGAALSLAFAASAPSLAIAQTQDEAAARTLFLEGRKLLQAGRYEEACPKFEAAKQLYTSAGVLLNLADCHEHINRTASAWTEFGDAALAAANAGRPKDEAAARRRQNALDSRLSRLAIRVVSAARDQVVKRDGTLLDRAAWDTAIPVDPGMHTVVAEASGRQSWSTSVSLSEPGKTVSLEIPELAKLPTPVATASTSTAREAGADGIGLKTSWSPEAPPRTPSTGTTQRTIGLVVGGAGVLGMVGAGVLALLAKSQYGTAEGDTGPARVTDSVSAGKLADGATLAVGIGGAVAVTGAVLWFTAPSAPVSINSNGRAVFLSGRFQ